MLKPLLRVEDNPDDRELTLTARAETGLMTEGMAARDGAAALDNVVRERRYEHWPSGNPAVVPGFKLLKSGALLASGYEYGTDAYSVKPATFRDFLRRNPNPSIFWAVLDEAHPNLPGNS